LKGGDPLRADLEEIHNAGERAAVLTHQLLAFSRRQVLQPAVLNLNTLVAEMESMLRRLIGEDIDLVVVRAQGLGSIKADPGQIDQVIANLAVNARDAMPHGGKLTIETRDVELDADYARQHGVAVRPGPYVMLAITDTGTGMDEITRARIFEPFFTTKASDKGTGLGLSTVYGIVKQSEGLVWVYSEVGQGTSFKIYLPRVADVAGRTPQQPTIAPAHGTETILVVEDVEGLRKLAARMLHVAGYTVLTAADGQEARLLLERVDTPVHLMLTDVVMPGLSGPNLAQLFERSRPEMKVLYMSGYTDDTVMRHRILEEGLPFISKPFSVVGLTRKVREVLDSKD
jgi:CheY-like chemotaxis protein